MIMRLHIYGIVVLVVAIVVLGVWYIDGSVSGTVWKTITPAAAGVGILIDGFNSWFWRWRLWQGWLVRRPHLWGEWSVKIDSFWREHPESPNRGQVPATFTIRQTYTGLQIHMESEESTGDLLSANIIQKEDGTYVVSGIYRNEPRLSMRDRSPIHYGAFLLDVKGPANHPNELKGHYWTDRDTKGETIAVRASALKIA